MGLVQVTAYYAELVFAQEYEGCFPLAFAGQGRMFVCLERELVETVVATLPKKAHKISAAEFMLDTENNTGFFVGTNEEHDCLPVLTRKVYQLLATKPPPFIWWDEVRRPAAQIFSGQSAHAYNPWHVASGGK